ncbi:hypothetical protein BDY21DRAFT_367144 [Lineolata rhizophorae]|uniref:Uncharacterized protein n=1 Tax=Lineolata rhizophorae TaxID=578093 RepID=A0A6A6NNT4_9PEZI|nr:hypothetical protein BDY21DRAFT_367144 [Lineolata rhizophorae]
MMNLLFEEWEDTDYSDELPYWRPISRPLLQYADQEKIGPIRDLAKMFQEKCWYDEQVRVESFTSFATETLTEAWVWIRVQRSQAGFDNYLLMISNLVVGYNFFDKVFNPPMANETEQLKELRGLIFTPMDPLAPEWTPTHIDTYRGTYVNVARILDSDGPCKAEKLFRRARNGGIEDTSAYQYLIAAAQWFSRTILTESTVATLAPNDPENFQLQPAINKLKEVAEWLGASSPLTQTVRDLEAQTSQLTAPVWQWTCTRVKSIEFESTGFLYRGWLNMDDPEPTGPFDEHTLPLGFALYGLLDLGGTKPERMLTNTENDWDMPLERRVMDRAFWCALYRSASPEVQQLLDANVAAITLMFRVGVLLKILPVDNPGKINAFERRLLPKLLRYQVTFDNDPSRVFAEA